jgi:dTDP-4-amino-4,6-dideoxygalactose transaminase
MRFRHQLPVYSPIPSRAVVAAAINAAGLQRDARGELAAILRGDFAADDVLLCGSGTQALQVAIECVRDGERPDAIVALPAFSCFDVASAAVGAGARVALYDLDPCSLSPDLESLARALDRGAMIVVVAPLYGVPVAWEQIARLAAEHGAVVIEDAAQGHGASYAGKPLGALGEISTISFGRGKGWTGGAGGAVLFRRGRRSPGPLPEPSTSRELRTVLGLAAQWGLGRPALYGLPLAIPGLDLGKTVYHPPVAPHSIAPAVAAAVLASREASRLEGERRRANAAWIRERLAGRPALREISPATRDDSVSGALRLPVLGARGLAGFPDRAAAMALGIAPSYPEELGTLAPLTPLLVEGRASWPGASRLVRELFTFPTHSRLSGVERSSLGELTDGYGGG